MLGVLIVGMTGYLTIEILERIKNKREKFDQNNRIMDVAKKSTKANNWKWILIALVCKFLIQL